MNLLTRSVAAVIPRDLAHKKLTSGERLRVYWGIDPTGAQIHLGHTLSLRKLKSFSELGHEVILVIGSFTAMIGDPTGRDAARAPLTKEDVEANFQDYKRQAEKILDFSKIEIRKNGDWLSPLNFSDIIKLASNFTVGSRCSSATCSSAASKTDKPISLHEFLYPLMVGYDSVVLDVDCELGGSDQEFNMLAGRHLQQAMGKRDKFVLTTKLIEGTRRPQDEQVVQ
jgi:tyrosyl-tRNA synthetase